MNENKNEAIKMRRQMKSYNDITAELGVPKSTLSEWFNHDAGSEKVKKILSGKTSARVAERIRKFVAGNQQRWEAWREQARQEARDMFEELKSDRLFVAGVMLYWAEGDNKPGNPFRFTNTSPAMISLYSRFLKQILKVSRENIRATMILYPDLSEEVCLRYWASALDISRAQFYKTQHIKGRNSPTKRLSHGICLVSCGNRQLKEKVLVWIDLLGKTL